MKKQTYWHWSYIGFPKKGGINYGHAYTISNTKYFPLAEAVEDKKEEVGLEDIIITYVRQVIKEEVDAYVKAKNASV